MHLAVITQVVEFRRNNGVLTGRAGGGGRYVNAITRLPPLVIAPPERDRIAETPDRALMAPESG